MKILLDLDKLLHEGRISQHEADHLRGLVDPHDRRIRGLWWIAVPAMLGLILGQLFVALRANVNPLIVFGEGGIAGLILGAGLGVLIWIFFPYADRKHETPPAPSVPATKMEEHHDPTKCPACGAELNGEPHRCPDCGIKLG
ncbi:MAG: hypothetical protein U0793_23055 [Gemmataceae bacterium]